MSNLGRIREKAKKQNKTKQKKKQQKSKSLIDMSWPLFGYMTVINFGGTPIIFLTECASILVKWDPLLSIFLPQIPHIHKNHNFSSIMGPLFKDFW